MMLDLILVEAAGVEPPGMWSLHPDWGPLLHRDGMTSDSVLFTLFLFSLKDIKMKYAM
jgi:hypothetical protein